MTATDTRATATPEPPARGGEDPPAIMSFSNRLSRWDLKVSPYLYISPFFILFVIVGLFPIAYTAVISFQEWDLVRNTGTFVGFDQYIWILSQPQFWIALRNTFSIFLLSTVPQLILALFIAAMLDRNIRAKTFWRMSVLLPFVMAPVAVALIFSNLFGDNHGLVNNILTDIGLPAIPWHKDPFWSHVAIATMVNFRWTGYNALILLAAMQAVPREYYEAATVDGANAFRQFCEHHAPVAAAHAHLRHHHLDHRRPADLRRAAHVRPERQRRRRSAVADDHAVPLRDRLGRVQLRPGRRARVDPVPHHPGHRPDQPRSSPGDSCATKAAAASSERRRRTEGSPAMSAISTPPLAIVEENLPNDRRRRRNAADHPHPRHPPRLLGLHRPRRRRRLGDLPATTGRS